ncbi:MAG: hypothetical protein ACRBCT_02340 [Alphaproteobacteria bacterium]
MAQNFVSSLDPIYKDLDTKNVNNKGAEVVSSVPDGTTLLLRPRAADLIFDTDIYALKDNGRIYLSLSDVIFVFNFPVEFDEDAGMGQGWFLREDWEIVLNLPEKQVVSRGRQIPVYEEDIIVQDGLYFVDGNRLTDWLGVSFAYDVSQQYIDVSSVYPIPVVDRYRRENKKVAGRAQDNDAEFPRTPQPKRALALAGLNISERVNYSRPGSADEFTRNESTNVIAEGQVLGHEARVSLSRNDKDGIQSASGRVSNRSEYPELLGPLQATYYEAGDISGASVPLAGGAGSGVGMRITNNPLQSDNFTTTIIEGLSLPDWDVELYRNGILIETQRVDSDGEYRFAEVPLFAGDNNFEILFYGVQGEIRRETLSVPVNSDLISSQQDVYDVSLTFENTKLYERFESDDPDKGEPDVAVNYSTSLAGKYVFMGLRSKPQDEERKSFLTAGTSFIENNTIFDASLGVDDNAEMAASFSARRDLDDWDLSAGIDLETDGYGETSDIVSTIFAANFRAQRRFDQGDWFTSSNLLFDAGYNLFDSGESSYGTRLSASTNMLGFNINNGLSYDSYDFDEEREDEAGYSVSLRKSLGAAYVRGGLDYRFLPEARAERYFAQGYYRFGNDKTVDLSWDYSPQTEFSLARLNLSYENDYFRTTPFIERNSDKDIRAGVSVNFNLVNTPGKIAPDVTSDNIIGRGMLHAFVYLDHDGNLVYDEGVDEPLPEVLIQSMNAKRSGETDEDGRVTLREITAGFPTDIKVMEDTLPDFLMVSARPDRSILPLGGQRHDFDFPIHMAGEVDGTIYIKTKEDFTRVLGRFFLQLIPLDRPDLDAPEAQVAFDGFYLFSKIRPGRYLLIPKTPGSKAERGNPLPQIVTINYEGDILAEMDITFREDRGFVEYDVQHGEMSSSAAINFDAPLALEYALLVQDKKKSELGNFLQGLTMRLFGRGALKGLQKVDAAPEYAAKGYSVYAGAQEVLHEACSKLSSKNMSCKIVMRVNSTDAGADTQIADDEESADQLAGL